MGQVGIMIYFMLPVAVRAGRTSLLAIPLAGAVCCLVAALVKEKRSPVYRIFCKFLAAGFGLLVWYRLSRLLAGYLGLERYWIVAGVVLVLLLLLGWRGMENPEGLKSLWSKALGILLLILLLFQIPNLKPEYVFRFSHSDSTGLWKEVLILLILHVPFWLELGKSVSKGRQSQWKKQLVLWILFFLLYIVLTGTFHFPLLVQSENMFLNLGRSAVWFDKLPVRMEIPADIILWVSVFFALWECVAVLSEPVRQEKQSLETGQEKTSGKEIL
ncbi:MAG: hypothetical protein ACI39H_04040 [Lachnospiraceae bacterium]